METQNKIIVNIVGNVTTSPKGINILMQFYFDASKYYNTVIEVDLSNMTWIDANLAALFEALIFKLETENNLTLTTNFDYAFSKFHVLFRNGCLQDSNYSFEDVEKTTIPVKKFLPTELQDFSEYIQLQLMANRGMNYIEKKIKHQIHSDLYDVFQNILRHARTDLPGFICGQYYPNKKRFMLTLVDLGVGFLVPIREHEKGAINTDIEAIKWAVSGGSSKVVNAACEIGGLGLSGIFDYCINNNGIFQIYTGKGFWSSSLAAMGIEGYKLSHNFNGSVLNLIFAVDYKN
ncbi:hypothetical protein QWZ08_20090 [Ferruginibacter paludis]|uniref:hypothetical protein n=1 Tax=Ferruginibacter paludis TaxID=1310417 RepID=UPI0025B46DF5|nr:hypothetical protein [Ferruginibacter paludis]MDN3657965.1 hypothetical protein [Ferruginibacter paludis]